MGGMFERRRFLLACASTATALLLPSTLVARERAWRRGRMPLIDALGSPGEYSAEAYAPLSPKALADVRASGLDAVNVTVSGVGSYRDDYDETIRNVGYWNAQVAANPQHLLVVRAQADIEAARRGGRLGLVYGFQDATPLAEDLDRIELFSDLGVRVVQLTYNRRNLVGDGCLESGNAGLSGFGRDVVARLNERRLLIDLSHAGERTTLEAIAASKHPLAISHTGCAALAALPRNKTDAELRALADKGGVAGIYLMPFLRVKGQPTAEDLVAHIEHAVRICGEDHVGIGTDGTISPVQFDDAFRAKHAKDVADRRARGISAPGESADIYTFLPDLNHADRFARIGTLLARRGHGDARIGKILGGNFMRLFGEVWGR